MPRSREVLEFKVVLAEIQPPIWRRIQVASTETFWGLHCAIQDAMGWFDYHLHEFRVPVSSAIARIGIPDPDGYTDPPDYRASWQERLDDYFLETPQAEYEYDFGDGWIHELTLEDRIAAEAGVKYPRCLGGERACPPEDCGGTAGYQEFVEAILMVTHPQHDEMLQWWGRPFDPDAFNASAVRFSSSKSRLKLLLESKA